MKNNLEMEQEFGDKKLKLLKNGDEKHWPKYFGDLRGFYPMFKNPSGLVLM